MVLTTIEGGLFSIVPLCYKKPLASGANCNQYIGQVLFLIILKPALSQI
jgi:hypothetical protein